jgi:hypothetical protein
LNPVILGFRRNRPTPLARLTACLAVALVLVLGVLSSSPELHERLHGHPAALAGTGHDDSQDSEVGCVVTLFTQGLVLALSVFALLLLGRTQVGAQRAPSRVFVPEEPDYRLLPTQGPPRD